MNDIVIDLERKSYPPVGRCVYCGSNGDTRGLRKEHIIPYALGGNTVILHASCADCEAITSYLEGYVGRDIFGSIRAYYEFQKRKRKEAQTVTMTFETSGGERQPRKVLVKDAPPLLFMREFEPPGIIANRLRGPVVLKSTGWVWYSHEFKQKAESLRQPGDLSWSVPFPFKEDVYSRFLAKVAHCMAVAHFGIDSFQPYLPPLIAGADKDGGWLVGGGKPASGGVAQFPKGRHKIFGHAVSMGLMRHTVTKHTFLYADIQLFRFTGSPSYCVVVGEPGPAILKQLL